MRKVIRVAPAGVAAANAPLLLQSLGLGGPRGIERRNGTTFLVSLLVHSALALLVLLGPLVAYDAAPAYTLTFFAEPLQMPLAPPPPAAPPGGVSGLRRAQPPRATSTKSFVAPDTVPTLVDVESLDLGPGGGNEGVVGGDPETRFVGAVIGDAPNIAAPPPPPRVIRIHRGVAPPQPIHKVAPVYPELARTAGVSGVVEIEAEVDTTGQVKSMRVVRGNPLLDEAALAAVKQWRYRPMLVSGEPTGFVLNVSITFSLQRG